MYVFISNYTNYVGDFELKESVSRQWFSKIEKSMKDFSFFVPNEGDLFSLCVIQIKRGPCKDRVM